MELCREDLRLSILTEYEFRLIEHSELEWLWNRGVRVLKLLAEIPSKIKEYFGEDTRMALRIIKDSEDTFYFRIVLYIVTEKDVSDTIRRLELFDRDWWLGIPPDLSSIISINTEYV